ncbi:LOW QUALITY PROTEIN: titin-like [Haliotis rubra]|uniref:LOW QUALITY PROTEIN: titin-like n=1 Tax=Haliotis rubra TaxID=36100 RepID=UPI001EE4FF3D|nr:LOW QUALITY PROTEIN: titin-like [Haliotis rubra]
MRSSDFLVTVTDIERQEKINLSISTSDLSTSTDADAHLRDVADDAEELETGAKFSSGDSEDDVLADDVVDDGSNVEEREDIVKSDQDTSEDKEVTEESEDVEEGVDVSKSEQDQLEEMMLAQGQVAQETLSEDTETGISDIDKQDIKSLRYMYEKEFEELRRFESFDDLEPGIESHFESLQSQLPSDEHGSIDEEEVTEIQESIESPKHRVNELTESENDMDESYENLIETSGESSVEYQHRPLEQLAALTTSTPTKTETIDKLSQEAADELEESVEDTESHEGPLETSGESYLEENQHRQLEQDLKTSTETFTSETDEFEDSASMAEPEHRQLIQPDNGDMFSESSLSAESHVVKSENRFFNVPTLENLVQMTMSSSGEYNELIRDLTLSETDTFDPYDDSGTIPKEPVSECQDNLAEDDQGEEEDIDETKAAEDLVQAVIASAVVSLQEESKVTDVTDKQVETEIDRREEFADELFPGKRPSVERSTPQTAAVDVQDESSIQGLIEMDSVVDESTEGESIAPSGDVQVVQEEPAEEDVHWSRRDSSVTEGPSFDQLKGILAMVVPAAPEYYDQEATATHVSGEESQGIEEQQLVGDNQKIDYSPESDNQAEGSTEIAESVNAYDTQLPSEDKVEPISHTSESEENIEGELLTNMESLRYMYEKEFTELMQFPDSEETSAQTITSVDHYSESEQEVSTTELEPPVQPEQQDREEEVDEPFTEALDTYVQDNNAEQPQERSIDHMEEVISTTDIPDSEEQEEKGLSFEGSKEDLQHNTDGEGLHYVLSEDHSEVEDDFKEDHERSSSISQPEEDVPPPCDNAEDKAGRESERQFEEYEESAQQQRETSDSVIASELERSDDITPDEDTSGPSEVNDLTIDETEKLAEEIVQIAVQSALSDLQEIDQAASTENSLSNEEGSSFIEDNNADQEVTEDTEYPTEVVTTCDEQKDAETGAVESEPVQTVEDDLPGNETEDVDEMEKVAEEIVQSALESAQAALTHPDQFIPVNEARTEDVTLQEHVHHEDHHVEQADHVPAIEPDEVKEAEDKNSAERSFDQQQQTVVIPTDEVLQDSRERPDSECDRFEEDILPVNENSGDSSVGYEESLTEVLKTETKVFNAETSRSEEQLSSSDPEEFGDQQESSENRPQFSRQESLLMRRIRSIVSESDEEEFEEPEPSTDRTEEFMPSKDITASAYRGQQDQDAPYGSDEDYEEERLEYEDASVQDTYISDQRETEDVFCEETEDRETDSRQGFSDTSGSITSESTTLVPDECDSHQMTEQLDVIQEKASDPEDRVDEDTIDKDEDQAQEEDVTLTTDDSSDQVTFTEAEESAELDETDEKSDDVDMPEPVCTDPPTSQLEVTQATEDRAPEMDEGRSVRESSIDHTERFLYAVEERETELVQPPEDMVPVDDVDESISKEVTNITEELVKMTDDETSDRHGTHHFVLNPEADEFIPQSDEWKLQHIQDTTSVSMISESRLETDYRHRPMESADSELTLDQLTEKIASFCFDEQAEHKYTSCQQSLPDTGFEHRMINEEATSLVKEEILKQEDRALDDQKTILEGETDRVQVTEERSPGEEFTYGEERTALKEDEIVNDKEDTVLGEEETTLDTEETILEEGPALQGEETKLDKEETILEREGTRLGEEEPHVKEETMPEGETALEGEAILDEELTVPVQEIAPAEVDKDEITKDEDEIKIDIKTSVEEETDQDENRSYLKKTRYLTRMRQHLMKKMTDLDSVPVLEGEAVLEEKETVLEKGEAIPDEEEADLEGEKPDVIEEETILDKEEITLDKEQADLGKEQPILEEETGVKMGEVALDEDEAIHTEEKTALWERGTTLGQEDTHLALEGSILEGATAPDGEAVLDKEQTSPGLEMALAEEETSLEYEEMAFNEDQKTCDEIKSSLSEAETDQDEEQIIPEEEMILAKDEKMTDLDSVTVLEEKETVLEKGETTIDEEEKDLEGEKPEIIQEETILDKEVMTLDKEHTDLDEEQPILEEEAEVKKGEVAFNEDETVLDKRTVLEGEMVFDKDETLGKEETAEEMNLDEEEEFEDASENEETPIETAPDQEETHPGEVLDDKGQILGEPLADEEVTARYEPVNKDEMLTVEALAKELTEEMVLEKEETHIQAALKDDDMPKEEALDQDVCARSIPLDAEGSSGVLSVDGEEEMPRGESLATKERSRDVVLDKDETLREDAIEEEGTPRLESFEDTEIPKEDEAGSSRNETLLEEQSPRKSSKESSPKEEETNTNMQLYEEQASRAETVVNEESPIEFALASQKPDDADKSDFADDETADIDSDIVQSEKESETQAKDAKPEPELLEHFEEFAENYIAMSSSIYTDEESKAADESSELESSDPQAEESGGTDRQKTLEVDDETLLITNDTEPTVFDRVAETDDTSTLTDTLEKSETDATQTGGASTDKEVSETELTETDESGCGDMNLLDSMQTGDIKEIIMELEKLKPSDSDLEKLVQEVTQEEDIDICPDYLAVEGMVTKSMCESSLTSQETSPDRESDSSNALSFDIDTTTLVPSSAEEDKFMLSGNEDTSASLCLSTQETLDFENAKVDASAMVFEKVQQAKIKRIESQEIYEFDEVSTVAICGDGQAALDSLKDESKSLSEVSCEDEKETSGECTGESQYDTQCVEDMQSNQTDFEKVVYDLPVVSDNGQAAAMNLEGSPGTPSSDGLPEDLKTAANLLVTPPENTVLSDSYLDQSAKSMNKESVGADAFGDVIERDDEEEHFYRPEEVELKMDSLGILTPPESAHTESGSDSLDAEYEMVQVDDTDDDVKADNHFDAEDDWVIAEAEKKKFENLEPKLEESMDIVPTEVQPKEHEAAGGTTDESRRTRIPSLYQRTMSAALSGATEEMDWQLDTTSIVTDEDDDLFVEGDTGVNTEASSKEKRPRIPSLYNRQMSAALSGVTEIPDWQSEVFTEMIRGQENDDDVTLVDDDKTMKTDDESTSSAAISVRNPFGALASDTTDTTSESESIAGKIYTYKALQERTELERDVLQRKLTVDSEPTISTGVDEETKQETKKKKKLKKSSPVQYDESEQAWATKPEISEQKPTEPQQPVETPDTVNEAKKRKRRRRRSLWKRSQKRFLKRTQKKQQPYKSHHYSLLLM